MNFLKLLKSIGGFAGRAAPKALTQPAIQAKIQTLPWGGLINMIISAVAGAQATVPDIGAGAIRHSLSLTTIEAASGFIVAAMEAAANKSLSPQERDALGASIVRLKNEVVIISKLTGVLVSGTPAPGDTNAPV